MLEEKMLIRKKTPEPVPTTEKVQMLAKSISEVSKYELLTTNQYLQQMKLVLEIFNDISREAN
jgi:hypothetical protein